MKRTRYWWVIAVAAIVALLAPLQQAGAGAAAGATPAGNGGGQVAQYGGLSAAQRANLLSIARDTWKFYGVDVDSATNLPMDNLTFAGGSATPTSYGHYTSAANIGVYLWAVVSARDLGLINEEQARDKVQATLTEVSHLQRQRAPQPRSGRLHPRGGADEQQLLLLVQRRQRLVRLRAHRGPGGHAGAGAPGGQPDRADELRDLLRQPGRDPLQYQPGDHGEPADRPDVRRVLRRAAAVPG